MIRLYIDGTLVGEQETPSLPIARGEHEVTVGRYSSSGYFLGDIDEVNVYNHEWSPAEVAAHYAALRP